MSRSKASRQPSIPHALQITPQYFGAQTRRPPLSQWQSVAHESDGANRRHERRRRQATGQLSGRTGPELMSLVSLARALLPQTSQSIDPHPGVYSMKHALISSLSHAVGIHTHRRWVSVGLLGAEKSGDFVGTLSASRMEVFGEPLAPELISVIPQEHFPSRSPTLYGPSPSWALPEVRGGLRG